VIIVGRGGGSFEDLYPFNEEVVARAIVGSKAPVISAVGHEVDFTISDFVADLRAATPSAAAEMVVREKQAVVESVGDLRARLERAATRHLERERRHLGSLATRRVLTDAARPLRDHQRRVDEATARLRRALDAGLRTMAHRVELLTRGLRREGPVARLQSQQRQLDHLRRRLHDDGRHTLDRSRRRLASAAERLQSLSPLGVLARGYSLTRLPDGEVVRHPRQAPPGTRITVMLDDGSLLAQVEEANENARERDG
jgi:exodeoxyribonuclease VII large subunit